MYIAIQVCFSLSVFLFVASSVDQTWIKLIGKLEKSGKEVAESIERNEVYSQITRKTNEY